MVTLKDIAKEAGVSVMTVSRVVNCRHNEVSEENRIKIEEIIKRLGYVPNSSARSLSSRSSRIISVVIQGGGNPLSSPYNAHMLGYIIQGVQDRGYSAMVHFIKEYGEITKHLQSWKAEGAIFLGTFDKNIRRIQESNKIPLIFTDSYSSERQFINIGIDDYKGGCLAAEYFIQRGHKEFAFYSPHINTSQLIQQRLKGFQDTILKHKYSFPPSHILEPTDGIQKCIDQLCNIKENITAIFTSSDTDAIQLIAELQKKNLSVPRDYSIIGFDNLPISQYSTPALTTIAQDIPQKAQYALDTLFMHLQNHTLPAQSLVLDVSLIERASVRNINKQIK